MISLHENCRLILISYKIKNYHKNKMVGVITDKFHLVWARKKGIEAIIVLFKKTARFISWKYAIVLYNIFLMSILFKRRKIN